MEKGCRCRCRVWDFGGAGLVGVELWWEVGEKCGDVGGWC